jgi:GTP:adenosylcobinamide-phosphate guanylyltransferase
MDSVAEYLNIQNREQLSSVNINTKPDFKLVNKQIQQFRQSSLDKLSLYLDS